MGALIRGPPTALGCGRGPHGKACGRSPTTPLTGWQRRTLRRLTRLSASWLGTVRSMAEEISERDIVYESALQLWAAARTEFDPYEVPPAEWGDAVVPVRDVDIATDAKFGTTGTLPRPRRLLPEQLPTAEGNARSRRRY
jgi:hypothetical protein